jgi:hypothetical protein
MSTDDKLHLCVCEDRLSMYPALRVLLSSLSLHSPSAHLHLFLNSPTNELLDFIAKLNLNVAIYEFPVVGIGYNVKPFVLAQLLSSNINRILWLDSDIIVSASFRKFIQTLRSGVLEIAEEMLGRFYDNSARNRTSAWGFVVQRYFPFALNTGVLFVDRSHLDLILQWSQLLSSRIYQRAQSLPWDERPAHLLGDQDVLCALLGSEEFSAIEVHVLRRGEGIIQFSGPYGYTLRERFIHWFRGSPPFVHSLGDKPWLPKRKGESFFDRFCYFYSGCSPYIFLARKHQADLIERSWLEPRNFSDRLFRCLGFGSMPLTGLPFAFVADSMRGLKSVRMLGQRLTSFFVQRFRTLFCGQ